MVRVHRQMSADGVPFSPDQAVSSLTTQLQVSTTQVKIADSQEKGALFMLLHWPPKIPNSHSRKIYLKKLMSFSSSSWFLNINLSGVQKACFMRKNQFFPGVMKQHFNP